MNFSFKRRMPDTPPAAEPEPQAVVDPAELTELRRYCSKFLRRAHVVIEPTGQTTVFLDDPAATGHAIDADQRRAKRGWLSDWQK
jgi:hypothetical protein